jgi:hypothetical protein
VIGRLLLRLILVPLGAAVALAAAGALLVVTQWNAFHAVLAANPQAQQDYVFALMVAGPLLASLMSAWAHYTFVPALAGVLVAETFAIRSWMFHVGNGALCALLGWTLTRDLRDEHHFFSNPTILVAAGIAAGFAYWLIAGWTAGFWKPVGASAPSPRLRGEGRGEGAYSRARTRGEAPSPGAQERADLSPQAGRGVRIRRDDV